MELKDTVPYMLSDEYKKRFQGEYFQVKIRYEKLKSFCTKIEAAQMINHYDDLEDLPEPKHDCPLELLRTQQAQMGAYLHSLELRAQMEHINLTPDVSILPVFSKK